MLDTKTCHRCNKPVEITKCSIIGKMQSLTYSCRHTSMRFLTPAEIQANAEYYSPTDEGIYCPIFDFTTNQAPSIEQVNEVIETQELIERFEDADNLLESLTLDNQPDNWQKLFPYQREGVLFGEGANLRFILCDEPGLGKTVQFVLMLDRNWDKMKNCLIVCPPSITTHWERFLKKWLSTGRLNEAKPHLSIYIHKGRNVPLPEDFDITIVGNNLIAAQFAKESILENKYQSVCIDECHHFKSDKSARTQAMLEIAETIPHIIAMSGTPIMNRVDEYYPILHMIKPNHWPDKQSLTNICEKNDRGQALSIRTSMRPWFFERTKNYIIRRKKKDHLTGLPKFTRISEFLNPESLNPVQAKRFAASYNMLADQLEEEMAKSEGSNILGIMSMIRRVTGEAKAQSGVEYALDLLDSDENGTEKLIIGVHHKNTAYLVKTFLERAAKERNDPTLIPLEMGSGDGYYKDAIKHQFATQPNRVLICSILACAEGLDGLQLICSRMLNLEREWNSSKEEQFEQRLDRLGQQFPVQAIYFMMLKTIDEWLHELIELKRNVVNSTFDANFEVDHNLMRDLANKVVQNRMRFIGV